MLFEEKESNLIRLFQLLDEDEIFIVNEYDDVEKIVESIHNEKMWQKWLDSSAKDELPPDFYSNELKLMMEVMRVDDHAFENGKYISNPTLKKEHEIEKSLRKNGLDEMIPDVNLIVIADSKLSTEKDHNYKFYRDSFKRTVLKHVSHIPNYKKNHPNYKLIFFVFDESSMYAEAPVKLKDTDTTFKGAPHEFFLDEDFLSTFEKVGIDYLIWFAPYKIVNTMNPIPKFFKAYVYKTDETLPKKIKYNEDLMVSVAR